MELQPRVSRSCSGFEVCASIHILDVIPQGRRKSGPGREKKMGSKTRNSSGVCPRGGGDPLKGPMEARGRLAPLIAVVAALLVRSSARGDFLDPRQLSETGGNVTQCTVGADLSLNAYVAW